MSKNKSVVTIFRLNRYDEDGGTSDVAIVTASTSDGETDPNEIMGRISKAVARWIEGTEEGKTLWRETNGDLNIADINEHDANLTLELLRQGVNGLAIQINPANEPEATNFSFDTVLPLRVDDFNEPEE